MNYGRVNNKVVYAPELSLEAKGLYAIVCSLCGSKDYCYPTLQTLADLSGKSKSTVQRLLRELARQGVVRRGYDGTLCKTITVHLLDPKNSTL